MNQELTTNGSIASMDLDQIDFFSPGVLQNPYELFARLRRERPVAKFVHPVYGYPEYIVTTHALVEEVFRDGARFSSNFIDMVTGGGKGNPEAAAILASTWPEVDTLLTADGENHKRLRALAAKAFMPARINRMAQLIGVVIDDLIDSFIERGECDFIHEFAAPLPIHAIGAALGISSRYFGRMHDWTVSMARRFGQMGSDAEQLEDARCIVEFKEFVRDLVKDREVAPRDDIVSDLVTARVNGANPLTELEIMSTVVLLVLGGAETTRNTLTFTVARLLQKAAQNTNWSMSPSLVAKAMEETLRFDAPGSASWRRATCDTELGGVAIPKGATLMLRLDSAGRDEAVFHEPSKFDLDRKNVADHLSFGRGIHTCIGFRFAREQVHQALTALFQRLQGLRICLPLSDLGIDPSSSHIRSPKALQLTFTPGTKRPVSTQQPHQIPPGDP